MKLDFQFKVSTRYALMRKCHPIRKVHQGLLSIFGLERIRDNTSFIYFILAFRQPGSARTFAELCSEGLILPDNLYQFFLTFE